MPTKEDEYNYYSDSPGILYSVGEWTKLNDEKKNIDKGELPQGWPKKLDGPHLWTGRELENNPDRYRYLLTGEDKQEIESAVKQFKDSGKDISQVNQRTFPLENLGPKLEKFADELYHGIGVRLIRGLNIDDYDQHGKIVAYLGISSHIADIRDAQGLSRALTHIKSIAHIPKDKRAPIGVSQQTTDPQMFHNDFGGDIVSLLVLSTPASGGRSLVASTYSVYNELAKERPDILRTMASPNGFQRRDAPEGGALIHYISGEFITAFSTRNFIGFKELPRDETYRLIDSAERDAVGGFNAIAYKHSLSCEFVKGDIEYVNNFYTQHCRKGFTEDDSHRRHLARLWLRNSKYASKVKLPTSIKEKRDVFFPIEYEQEVPLDEFEEDAIKVKNDANTIDKFYAKPK